MEFTVNEYDPEDEGWPLEPWMQFMSILVDDEPEPGPEPEPEPTEVENKKYKTYISRLKKFITKYQN